jgi:hypothetical protein
VNGTPDLPRGSLVVLPIQEIIRHPDFDEGEGKGVGEGSDIAVFRVNDANLKNPRGKRIYPACLPTNGTPQPTRGVHSGWTLPPLFPLLDNLVPGRYDGERSMVLKKKIRRKIRRRKISGFELPR